MTVWGPVGLNVAFRPKKNQNRCHKARFMGSNVLKMLLRSQTLRKGYGWDRREWGKGGKRGKGGKERRGGKAGDTP